MITPCDPLGMLLTPAAYTACPRSRERLPPGMSYAATMDDGAPVGDTLGRAVSPREARLVFIPWIGPLIGWAVLPSFAIVLAPDAVVAGLVIGLVVAFASQLLVTQLVMGAAVNMSPVAVFVVVFIGAALAGVMGAIFAIPVAAAILAITDYLRRRDVLLRSDETDETDETAQVAQVAETGG